MISPICSGKRLLILGGLRYQIPVIRAAQKLGCYVVTADIYPENIAHGFSDYYCNLNIVNKDEVLTAARKLKVDGIMSFAADPGVISAAYACEKLGLPSPGPYESVRILQSKDLFRKYLADNGFNTPKSTVCSSIDKLTEQIRELKFPLFVKPVDSAGSKGVSRVSEPEHMRKAFEDAIRFSISRKVIIEEVIDSHGHPSDSDNFSIKGDLAFFSISDQYFDENALNPYAPEAYIWPSSTHVSKLLEIKGDIQRLVNQLRMKTGVYNIETRIGKDNKPYIMECSPRGGGNRISEVLSLQQGIDLMENSVLAALGYDEGIEFAQQPDDCPHWGIIILHSNNKGVFQNIKISDYASSYLHEIDLWVSPGAHVSEFTGANATIGTLILKSKDRFAMEDVIRNRHELFKVVVD